MLKTLLAIALGLTPAILSFMMIKRMEAQYLARIRAARAIAPPRRHLTLPPDAFYLEGVGYLIGDISCRYNARSAYIRCTVNPKGDCKNCRDYEARE